MILLGLTTLILTACNQTPPPTPATTLAPSGPAVFADTTAEKTAVITSTRAFFKWYTGFVASPEYQKTAYNFIDTTGTHLKLNMPALDKYLNLFVKGGYAGTDFLQFEKNYYLKCEKAWQKEEKDDIPSGMDADHIECSQEDMSDFFQKTPARVFFTGQDKATVSFPLEGEPKHNLNVFMKKEQGKWLYLGTDCDLGE
jgi:hypothetical protein